jgi:predicted dehydrogenase
MTQAGPVHAGVPAIRPGLRNCSGWLDFAPQWEIAMSSHTFSRRSLLGVSAALYAQQVPLPRKVRVAIIGLDGHPGEISGPLNRLPDVDVIAISNAPEEAIRRFVKGKPRMANARPYADLNKMLDAEKPDVVAVCNTNGERAAGVIAAAERKLPVIAEKPFAATRAELDRVKKAVRANGVKVGMLLPMRYSPPYLALKQIVTAGEIGDVILISSQKSYQLGSRPNWFTRQKTYGSTIIWIGPHMIDLMRWVSGRQYVEAASFMGRLGFPGLGDMETSTSTSFKLDNGGTATLHMDYCLPATAPYHGDDRLRLSGTKGVAEYMPASGVTFATAEKKLTRVTDLPPARSVFAEFLDSVYNGKAPSLPEEDIFAVCDATVAAHESAVQHAIVRV